MAKANIIQDNHARYAEVIYKIPFKIRVTNITVPGYSPVDIPPIGIAIVGLNNYIL